MLKIRTGDTVQVLIGKDKGRDGKVEKVYPKKGKLLIPGINMYKKHVKGTAGQNEGGIYDIPRALFISKVALVCPHCKKITRVGFKLTGKEKSRICRKCGRQIDIKAPQKKRKNRV